MKPYTDLRKQYLDEWRIWYRMCNVCANNETYYVETQVCDEWQGEQGFINWLDYVGPRPTSDSVLDRINKLGDYEPGNVEWTSKGISQSRSRRHETSDALKWKRIAHSNGIKRGTWYKRLSMGWSLEDAACLPAENKPLKTRTI